MTFKNKLYFLFSLSIISIVISGCVHNVPLTVDASKDIEHAFPRTKKIPAKVGIYLNNDIKHYIYKQTKVGMTFQMNIGEYVVPISRQMVSAIFEDVTFVDSLPPYKDYYSPDVEAVVEPEIIYCYGNAVGTISGHIEAELKMRITAYDLSGRILWRDETTGESRSENLNLVGTFLGGMEKVGKTGYDAAFAAAVKIINDFNARPPKELYSLVEIKRLATLKNRKNISNFNLFQKYYEKGQYQYEKKNYYQALYSFEKAEQINPDDLSTAFYIGVCCTYTAQKEKALRKFKEVVEQGPKSQEAMDAKKWIEILKEPLKIGILIPHKFGNIRSGDKALNDSVVQQSLTDSRMYELADMNETDYPGSVKSADFNRLLDNSFKKGIEIIIYATLDQASKKIDMANKTAGDVATQHVVKITASAYSTKKKTLQSEIMITEITSTIREITKEEERTIKQQLLDKGAEKLVLRLLQNNIF